MYRGLLAIISLVVILGCGSSSTAPSVPKVVIAQLSLQPHNRINVPVGDSIALLVSGSDQNGHPFVADSVWFAWRSDPAVGSVTRATFHAAESPGQTWLVAETPLGIRDSVLVTTYRGVGAFHITLQYAPDIPDRWRTELEFAARRWEATMTGELPHVTVSSDGGACGPIPGEPPIPHQSGIERGVRIYVGQSGGFPSGPSPVAVGGPCLQRGLPFPTTILGQITLDRQVPVTRIDAENLGFIAFHEMGHTLGLVALVQGEQPPWFDIGSEVYTGSMALEGWRRALGVPASELQTRGGHWTSPELFDIMGMGEGVPGPVPLSLVSIGALMDIGYPAAWAGAGPYR